jgi:shikimate dehydrogenase
VLGKPIAHSLSPVIHNAGYAAAGLDNWTYTATECDEAGLAALVAGLGPEWMGLSLTMPLKEVGLTVATSASPLAAALGAMNTLVRRPDGWFADNTDAPGMVDVLRAAGAGEVGRVSLLGGGGTARAALGAAHELGAHDVTVYVRRPQAGEELRPLAEKLGLRLTVAGWHDAPACGRADVVISTVPVGGADEIADACAGGGWPSRPAVFDVVYDPWPTPLAASAERAGCRVMSGLDLLLMQGVRQFELFTGVPAPVGAMDSALRAAAAR